MPTRLPVLLHNRKSASAGSAWANRIMVSIPKMHTLSARGRRLGAVARRKVSVRCNPTAVRSPIVLNPPDFARPAGPVNEDGWDVVGVGPGSEDRRDRQ